MYLRVSYTKKMNIFFLFCILKVTAKKESDPDPAPLVRGTNPRIQIQNVTDPQHRFWRVICLEQSQSNYFYLTFSRASVLRAIWLIF